MLVETIAKSNDFRGGAWDLRWIFRLFGVTEGKSK